MFAGRAIFPGVRPWNLGKTDHRSLVGLGREEWLQDPEGGTKVMIGQMKSALLAGGIIAGFCAAAGVPAAAAELDGNALLSADKDPNNWVMYHQSYKSWHYSPLDQINTGNVKDLKLLWMHTPGAGKRGIQSFPLVIDGRIYYTSTEGQVWALDATN